MVKLELFERELNNTIGGRKIMAELAGNMDEVLHLINRNREVMVVWQRNKGPQFFADILASGFEPKAVVVKQIGDVSLAALIRRMAAALQENGSAGLKKLIDNYFLTIINEVQTSDNLYQVFLKLRENG
ncbi:hypothetical protein GCM10007423_62360 [Dyadobacter endophyticus]|uniref:Uncharacterized protein n=1 Tax=Dyadobacter endophyticus TaxID=1749036 RepID=A0ABQ1ZCC4_9BACT|nr:hypothetical protein [Dyadobacter endophyticus]GGH55146.1 hypothetical protein GCM10007423_62360 [Dyadobacter endophyticus]